MSENQVCRAPTDGDIARMNGRAPAHNHAAVTLEVGPRERDGRRTIIARRDGAEVHRDVLNPNDDRHRVGFCERFAERDPNRGEYYAYNPTDGSQADLRWLSQRILDEVRKAEAGGDEITFPILTSGQLDAAEFEENWLVDDFIVARQPMIVAAPPKCLKTVLLMSLSLSLAMGVDFLGKFRVERAVRVLFFSAESGLSTLRKMARAMSRSMGFEFGDVGNLLWCDKAPKLAHALHLEAIQQEIRGHEVEVVIFDPAYLMLGTGGNENSLFAMGELLAGINAVCQKEHVTMILAHHTKKAGGEPGQPLELGSIAWSGFEQFARQWMLLSRREPYQGDQPGLHKLWMNYGGSAGHSGLWGLDIDEGPHHDRRWQVDVIPARLVRKDKEGEKDKAKADRQERKRERDREALVKAAARYPNGETENIIKGAAGLSGTRASIALQAALTAGDLVLVEITKSNRKKPYVGYKLPDSAPTA